MVVLTAETCWAMNEYWINNKISGIKLVFLFTQLLQKILSPDLLNVMHNWHFQVLRISNTATRNSKSRFTKLCSVGNANCLVLSSAYLIAFNLQRILETWVVRRLVTYVIKFFYICRTCRKSTNTIFYVLSNVLVLFKTQLLTISHWYALQNANESHNTFAK